HLQHKLIVAMNIRSFTGKRRPAERPSPFTENRPNIRRYKAGKIVRVLHALLVGEGANVVAVVKSGRAQLLQREHAFDVLRDGFERPLAVALGTALAQFRGLPHTRSLRNVPADGIVRA